MNEPTIIKIWAQYQGRKGLQYSIRNRKDELLTLGGGIDYEDTLMVIKRK
jgi:hypothetical protein